MRLQTERLYITRFTPQMAHSVHLNSLDPENRRFLPDEVFETPEAAAKTIASLTSFYDRDGAPKVYPVVLNDGTQIGHVQAAPARKHWELGYHIGAAHAGRGYATEAVRAFLPFILGELDIPWIAGVARVDNPASCAVLEKCGFVLEREGLGLYQGRIRRLRRYRYTAGDDGRP